MTYELAKKLKDAGFPIKGKDEWFFPDLSELIEACGEIELILRNASWNRIRNWECWKGGEWKQETENKTGGREMKFFQCASTPEEAVALLWLELNKK